MNLILNTDSYKAAHYRLYPPGTERVYCYIESRGGDWPSTVFFGLQALLKEWYRGEAVFQNEIEEAALFFAEHGLPFNRDGWQYIRDVHNGHLPISIRAVPEGLVIPTRNVLVTIENTDPHCYWLPTYLETSLLRAVWYPTTVATKSYYCKAVIRKYLEMTCDDPESVIDIKLHDFGGRGVSSFESSMLGGMAHLVNFKGTDTIAGILGANNFYKGGMAGGSIPASEHSVIIAWGREHEADAYRHLLNEFAVPGTAVACVSDSYNFEKAVRDIWCGELADQVRNSGATLVIRPDSGYPDEVVPSALTILGSAFGTVRNNKGFNVLPSYIRVIQGDGMDDENSIEDVLISCAAAKFSTENIGFGMGGGLLQQVNRDTLQFAMKASEVVVNGQARAISKTPVDDLNKQSKPGRLSLIQAHGPTGYATVQQVDDLDRDVLVEVFRDGEILREWTFDEVRANARLNSYQETV